MKFHIEDKKGMCRNVTSRVYGMIALASALSFVVGMIFTVAMTGGRPLQHYELASKFDYAARKKCSITIGNRNEYIIAKPARDENIKSCGKLDYADEIQRMFTNHYGYPSAILKDANSKVIKVQ